jgi:hypothetical protein
LGIAVLDDPDYNPKDRISLEFDRPKAFDFRIDDRPISIIGYPYKTENRWGMIKKDEHEIFKHEGTIQKFQHRGDGHYIVYYDVDASDGQAGAPLSLKGTL